MRLVVSFILLFAFHAQANIVGRVVEAKGNAFAFDSQGGSKRLSFGSRIVDMSEVMVDDSSYVSVLDGSGNVHHLSGGTYAKFYNKLLEVKNGSVWTVVRGDGYALVNTVNAVVKSSSGQFITSVDSEHLKTQVLTLTGEAKLSSAVEPDLGIEVAAGNFSFIDQSYKEGLPRTPTRVGLKSYQKMRAVFASVKSLEKGGFERSLFGLPGKAASKTVKRGIASVGAAPKKGKIIFMKTGSPQRLPASVAKEPSAMDYYKEVVANKAPAKKVKSNLGVAKVRHYGFDFSKKEAAQPGAVEAKKSEVNKAQTAQTVPGMEKGKIIIKPITDEEVREKAKRVPASVSSTGIVDEINSAFEGSLKSKLESNKRHPDEVNQLIDELKSYKRDYSKHY